MKNIKILLAFLIAFVFATSPSFASKKKIPLTKVCVGEMCYLEYYAGAGTYFNILSADTATFYKDTSALRAASPDIFLVDMPTGERTTKRAFPAFHVPEKVCYSLLGKGGADSAITRLDAYWARSETDTLWRSIADTTQFIFGGTSPTYGLGLEKERAMGSFKFNLNGYAAPKLLVTSATDTLYLNTAKFWACDD